MKVNLLGKGYEGLTMVTGVDDRNRTPYILIDRPSGFTEFIPNVIGERILFEFVGKDKIQYKFETVIEKVQDDDIWVRFPYVIDRIQRRRHFRIAPPLGTRIIFTVDNRHYDSTVINLSMGGVLIARDTDLPDKKTFFPGRQIQNVVLLYENDSTAMRIVIKKAEVLRIEKNQETGTYRYAIQFLDIDRRIGEQLKMFVYQSQRAVLRR